MSQTSQRLCGAFAGMRKTCLMVLSHLILNDMMKVKGHIARLALCLRDGDPRIAGLAQVFFHELSRKAFKVCALSPLLRHPMVFSDWRQACFAASSSVAPIQANKCLPKCVFGTEVTFKWPCFAALWKKDDTDWVCVRAGHQPHLQPPARHFLQPQRGARPAPRPLPGSPF
jgi:hypothetical protein